MTIETKWNGKERKCKDGDTPPKMNLQIIEQFQMNYRSLAGNKLLLL